MVPGGPLVRRLTPALVALSAIAVMLSGASSEAAAKKKKKSKRPPAVTAPNVVPPKPVETNEAPSATPSSAWGDVPLPPGMIAPKSVSPAPAPPPPAQTAAPVESAAPATGTYVIAVIVEGMAARDIDHEIRTAFAGKVQVVAPTQLEAAITPREQHIFDRPPNKRDLGRAMKRVAKKAGLDGVVYADISGTTKEGYNANVLLVYRSGKIGADGSVPVAKVVRQRGRNVMRWQYSNVSELLAPGIDGLAELPATDQSAPPPSEHDQGSLSESLATFDAGHGTGETAAQSQGEGEGEPVATGVVTSIPEEEPGETGTLFERRMTSPLVVKLGMEAGNRNFAYHEPITSNLRDYSVGVAPLALIEVEAYPFGRTSVAVLKNIGWYASYAQAFGLSSSFRSADQGQQLKVGNNWSNWQVGLHSRFFIGERFGIGPQLTYGFLNYGFKFKDATDQRAFEVPDVSYNFVRAGLEARTALWIFDLSVGAGWSAVLTGGRVASSYFPNSRTGLVDAYITVGLPISERFALDGSVRYARYFYDMRPAIGDTYVAGGAIDQYATASLSLVFLLEATHE